MSSFIKKKRQVEFQTDEITDQFTEEKKHATSKKRDGEIYIIVSLSTKLYSVRLYGGSG